MDQNNSEYGHFLRSDSLRFTEIGQQDGLWRQIDGGYKNKGNPYCKSNTKHQNMVEDFDLIDVLHQENSKMLIKHAEFQGNLSAFFKIFPF